MKENICIVGLGYVGLPLALALSKKFSCIGFDTNPDRVRELNRCNDTNNEHSADEISSSGLTVTDNLGAARECTVFIVTVGTPITSDKLPDLMGLEVACGSIGKILKKGDLVIFESTVHPGCTENFCGPLLAQASSLVQGEDFQLGYSPERINPGDKTNTICTIQKIVSGENDEVLDRVASIYGPVIDAGIFKAASIQVAEAAKLTENIQRDVNIGLMNELSSVFGGMGIRTQQVLEAASTKWNFIPFRPGLVGGHCISVDPYYLIDGAKKKGIRTPLIETARSVNESVVPRILKHYLDNVPVNHGRSLVMGLTFKENCNDLRNSKALELANAMAKLTTIHALEPNVEHIEDARFDLVNSFSQAPYDCVIIAVRHHQFDNISRHDLRKLIGAEGHIFDLHDSLKLEDDKGFTL